MSYIEESKMAEIAKKLADCNEAECFRVMSYLVIRLEYLHGMQQLQETGYVAS